MKTALYIGRFQPFHFGHYSVLTNLVAQGFQHIVLGIGSTQYQRTEKNPLSVTERHTCIEQTIQQRPLPARISIIDIPDIHDDAAWVDYVEKILYTVTTHYDVAISGNTWVERLFKEHGRMVQTIVPTIHVTGSQIRQWIRQQNPQWRDYVDVRCATWIEPIILASHGPDRVEDENSSLS